MPTMNSALRELQEYKLLVDKCEARLVRIDRQARRCEHSSNQMGRLIALIEDTLIEHQVDVTALETAK